MSDVFNTLTRDDFANTQWQNIVTATAERTCWAYHIQFLKEAENAANTGEITEYQVFLRLGLWTQPRLTDEADPFPEALLDVITEDDFVLLRELAPTVTDPELRARLADLAWQGRVQNKRDPEMARLAINSYLDAAPALSHQWWEQTSRVERALNLALSLGRNAKECGDVWKYIESALTAINGDDDWFLSARLMEILQEYGRGDANIYAPMAEKAAQKAESARGVGQWGKARRYWKVKAAWHEKESNEWFKAMERAAETHVSEAEDELNGFYGQKEPIAAAHHLQQAIEAYRRINSEDRFQTRIDTLHRQMVSVNQQAKATYQSKSYQVDLSDYARQAIESVQGQSFENAIRKLVLLYASPTKDVLRHHVEAKTSEFVELIAAHHQVNSKGQVIARRPSLLSSDATERDEAITAEMFNVATAHRGIFVNGMLIPALYQVRKEHQILTRDWVDLIQHSPFVPEDRILLFARGLQAGWRTEWDVAAHLLVPQIENSIRYILTNNGFLASALHPTGIQSEQGLDQTLKKEELSRVLPDELIFDLRGLLTEKMGDYFRHKTSHGLATFAEFYTAPSLYLWWLTLRLCLLPLLSIEAASKTDQPATDTTSNIRTDNVTSNAAEVKQVAE